MRITFLLPVISQARYYKRIRALEKLGIQSKILAFEREYYPGKFRLHEYQLLGKIAHMQYYKRILPFMKALFKMRAAVKGTVVIYAFDLDMLILGWLASFGFHKRLKIVYEVGDIRNILIEKGFISQCMRFLERFFLQRTHLLVVTSKAFVSEYYQGIQGIKNLKYHVIENKVYANSLPQIQNYSCNMSDDILRIGYFGLIRCTRSWKVLKKLAVKGNGRIQVYVRGIPPIGNERLHLVEEAMLTPNISYDGPYVSPDDLPIIFGNVDMVWACYPYQGKEIGNWCWARTHRFYQACFFKKPIFALEGTEDGRAVNGLRIGACLDLADIDDAVNRILDINKAECDRWQKNLAKLPEEIYTDTDEHEQLLELIS